MEYLLLVAPLMYLLTGFVHLGYAADKYEFERDDPMWMLVILWPVFVAVEIGTYFSKK